jgi:hypothetical protein
MQWAYYIMTGKQARKEDKKNKECISQKLIRIVDIHWDTKDKEDAVAVMASNIRLIVVVIKQHPAKHQCRS